MITKIKMTLLCDHTLNQIRSLPVYKNIHRSHGKSKLRKVALCKLILSQQQKNRSNKHKIKMKTTLSVRFQNIYDGPNFG